MSRVSAVPSTGRHEMARQSYLSRIAGAAPAPQLTAVNDAVTAQPATLSSLLQHLSAPAAAPRTLMAVSSQPAMAAPASELPADRIAKASPLPPTPRTDPVRFEQAAPASASLAAETAKPSQLHHPAAERPLVIDNIPETERTAVPRGPRQSAPPAPRAELPAMADPARTDAAQPAQVHVHIGTVEVRTKAPPVNAAPPAPAQIPAAATFPAPARGYGWGYGLSQR